MNDENPFPQIWRDQLTAKAYAKEITTPLKKIFGDDEVCLEWSAMQQDEIFRFSRPHHRKVYAPVADVAVGPFATARRYIEEYDGLSRRHQHLIERLLEAFDENLQRFGTHYCLVSHGAALREALGDPIQADRITLDYKRAGLDAKMEAILDFAVKLTKQMGKCNAADLAHLQSLGLTQAEVWDVIEIAAMYNYTNRMAAATGMLPNREYHALAH